MHDFLTVAYLIIIIRVDTRIYRRRPEENKKEEPKVYVYVPPSFKELEALTPRSRAKRDKEEKFKKRVADFSAMMAQKKAQKELEEQQAKREVYVYVYPDPMELARLTPRSRAKRDKEEKFKRRVAEFSQMMADKAWERELEEQFEKNT